MRAWRSTECPDRGTVARMGQTARSGSDEAADGGDAAGRRVDWECWVPDDHATLVFVVAGDEILLIRKKRGLGAGKINGPGGKIEAGESPLESAVREVREELCVTPTGLTHAGELSFQFTDGYAIHVHVFRARGCDGRPEETEEAEPLWTPLDRIPYEEMWADDRLWIPHLLAGDFFTGRFVFDGDAMLTSDLHASKASLGRSSA
jgi:8-oxo-dGTP diphosphatase